MSEHAPNKNAEGHYNDEISLKELILKLKGFWDELWKNWYLIILFCIPILAFFLYKHFKFEKAYTAELTFMVNENEGGGGLGGVSSVLGSFGFGGTPGGDYNLEKMLTLAKSRKIIQNVILKKVNLNGQEDYFANHFINIHDLHSHWAEDINSIDLSSFLFTHDSLSIFSLEENTALKYIHSSFIGNADKGINPLLNSSINELTGIMELSFKSKDEQFSIRILEELYAYLSKYYVDQAVEKQQNTYNIITAKADSLETELRSAEYSLANFLDTNRNLYARTDQVKQARLEQSVRMLGLAYAKVVEQKEIAEFSLNDQTPVVQIIDYPLSPIEPSKSSLVKNLIIACIIGGFLGAFFIISRRILRDTLA